jgi:hypothetical protein
MNKFLLPIVFVQLLICIVNAADGDDIHPNLATVVSSMRKNMITDLPELSLTCNRLRCIDKLHSDYSGGDIPLVYELVWKNNDFYVKRTFFPTDKQKMIKDVFITDLPVILVMKNGKLLEWEQGHNRCGIDNFDEIDTNFIQEWEIFPLLGINITKKIVEAAGVNYPDYVERKRGKSAYEFLDEKNYPDSFLEEGYVIRSQPESIDNKNCIVVELPNVDILWLDPELNYSLRKRIRYNNNDGHIKYTAYYQGYEEIHPNIFLPRKVIVDYYALTSVEPNENWGKVAKRVEFDILNVKTDKIDDSLFTVIPTLGTRVVDGIRKEQYRITDPNTDPFEGPIKAGIDALNKQRRYVVIRSLCIIVGSLLFLLLLWLTLDRKRNDTVNTDENKKK